MGCKGPQGLVIFLDIAGVLPHQLPEGFDTAKLADILQNAVGLLIKACSKDRDDHILCRTFAQSSKDSHNVNMELERCLIVPSNLAQLLSALLVFKELGVELDRFPHGSRRGDIELIHLHGDEIRPEDLAVIFDVL